jgi:hypothetical protein
MAPPNPPPTKRTRFEFQDDDDSSKSSDDSVQIVPPPNTHAPFNTCPLAAAKGKCANAIASLHPSLAPMISHCVQKFIGFHTQYHRRKQAVEKFSNPDFSPRSAKLGFSLQASAQAREHADFKALDKDVSGYLESFKTNARGACLSLANLEEKLAKEERNRYIITAVVNIVKAFLICTEEVPKDENNAFYFSILLLQKSDLSNAIGVTTETPLGPKLQPFFGTPTDAMTLSLTVKTTEFKKHLDVLAPALVDCFVGSVTAYDKALKNQQIKQQMTALQQAITCEQPTAEAAVQIDKEPALEPESMSALIRSEVNTATQKLRKELSELKAKAKNGPRGAPTHTPSSKKQSAPKPDPKKATKTAKAPPKATPSTKSGKASSAPRKQNGKAGGANNASGNAASSKQKTNGQKRSANPNNGSNKKSKQRATK